MTVVDSTFEREWAGYPSRRRRRRPARATAASRLDRSAPDGGLNDKGLDESRPKGAPSDDAGTFRAVLRGLERRQVAEARADADLEHKVPLVERRRMALERLEVALGPRRSDDAADQPVAGRQRVFELHRGPAPPAFYVIAVVIAVFVMLGLVMVLSATAQTEVGRNASPYALFNRQLVWAGIGAVGLTCAMNINLVWVRRLSVGGLAVGALGMLLPFVPGMGATINNNTAWVHLGPLSLQPSEFLKLAVAVFAADFLVRRHRQIADLRHGLRPVLVLAAVAAGACVVQGDLGSGIVMAAIVLAIAFIAGIPLIPMGAALAALAATATAFVVSSPYRLDRFTAFLDIAAHKEDRAYQLWQSQLAIAAGGGTGSGIGAGNGKLGYLPLAHSDFIFAVIADELGLIGSVAVIGGFGVLAWFGVQAALSSPDRFGMLLAGGIAAWFGVQAVINMGGVTALMPLTGLTLPFFSAGGSSLFVSMTAAGLLLNVARRGKRSPGRAQR